jgi:hypothetical protein
MVRFFNRLSCANSLSLIYNATTARKHTHLTCGKVRFKLDKKLITKELSCSWNSSSLRIMLRKSVPTLEASNTDKGLTFNSNIDLMPRDLWAL